MVASVIEDELQSITTIETRYIDGSARKRPLATNVALQLKRDATGNSEPFKERVVTGENGQNVDRTYTKIYAPAVGLAVVEIFM